MFWQCQAKSNSSTPSADVSSTKETLTSCGLWIGAFLQGQCTTSSLQGYSYTKQEHPWILQQLSAVFWSHGGVHNSILSINGPQKISNMQIQARPPQFDLNIVCTGGWKENIALPGTLSQFSSWNRGLEGFHFPLFYKNVFFSKTYQLEEWKILYLPVNFIISLANLG